MTNLPASLSRSEFDRIVARAIQLDEDGRERIDIAQATQIAQELGIAPDAWEAAVREFPRAQTTVAAQPPTKETVLRIVVAATFGFGAGLFAGSTGWADVSFAIVMWLAAGAMAVRGITSRTARTLRLELASMWLTLPFGIMIGAGKVLTDPLWFAAFSALGSVVFASGVRVWLARLRSKPQPDATPTA